MQIKIKDENRNESLLHSSKDDEMERKNVEGISILRIKGAVHVRFEGRNESERETVA